MKSSMEKVGRGSGRRSDTKYTTGFQWPNPMVKSIWLDFPDDNCSFLAEMSTAFFPILGKTITAVMFFISTSSELNSFNPRTIGCMSNFPPRISWMDLPRTSFEVASKIS